MDLKELQKCVSSDIRILAFRKHSKASEKYVDVRITFSPNDIWEGSIPYYYRRTGIFIETVSELCEYLKSIKKFFKQDNIKKFVENEKKRFQTEMAGKKVTKTFFDALLNMNWNGVENDLPNNPNWARRIQDIKEFGYTLATDTNREIAGSSTRGTHILLVPIPKGGVTGYEVMSTTFKNKAIKVLSRINIYELSSANKSGLLPDHKFPEIRWGKNTKEINENLHDRDIKEKFQLVDNQRNQQKREVCRKCFQTNKRGIIFGIEYFYEGGIDWPTNILKTGKEAENGCIGCGWYDIKKWRDSLNELIRNIK